MVGHRRAVKLSEAAGFFSFSGQHILSFMRYLVLFSGYSTLFCIFWKCGYEQCGFLSNSQLSLKFLWPGEHQSCYANSEKSLGFLKYVSRNYDINFTLQYSKFIGTTCEMALFYTVWSCWAKVSCSKAVPHNIKHSRFICFCQHRGHYTPTLEKLAVLN